MRKNGRWGNTQENALAMEALDQRAPLRPVIEKLRPTLQSDTANDSAALTELADDIVKDQVQRLPGVGSVRDLRQVLQPIYFWIIPAKVEGSQTVKIVASSASGRTATVAALVWMRPPLSVTGTRWTRWTPLSNLSFAKTPGPLIDATASL